MNKKDEALYLQNKVAAEQSCKSIESLYGPFSDEEIEHYRRALTKNGGQIINPLQNELIGYLYYKDMGDPITWNSLPNHTTYIKLMISAKRMLLNSGMVILPYIISSKVKRVSTRKVMSKGDMNEIVNDPLYQNFLNKYKDENVRNGFLEFVAQIKSSQFEIIDWDTKNNCPSEYDGKIAPIINYIINEEMLMYAIMI